MANNVSRLEWVPVKDGWVDWAWHPAINSGGLNFVAAYRVAKDEDVEDAERDAIFEAPPYPDRSPSDYWYIVYLPINEPEEFLLRDNYTVEELRNHIELKCKLFGMEQRSIERLREQGDLIEVAT